jgi:hypothetical protein
MTLYCVVSGKHPDGTHSSDTLVNRSEARVAVNGTVPVFEIGCGLATPRHGALKRGRNGWAYYHQKREVRLDDEPAQYAADLRLSPLP